MPKNWKDLLAPTEEGFGTLLILATLKDAPKITFKETG